MLKRQFVTIVIGMFTVIGGIGLVVSGMGALAHEGESDNCDTPVANHGPFMGISDPNASYDLRFIDEMILHHRGAIMSSEVMIAESEHPELRDLAQRIQEDQQRQIDQMLAWRAEWYPDAATPVMSMDEGNSSMGGMMDGNHMMGGMMSGMMGGMMDGELADRMFLRMMIPHHQLAIDMAEDALVNADHAELKTLAQEIIDGQSAEITEIEGYLQEWYDQGSTRASADGMRRMMQNMMGGCFPR